MFVVVDYTKEYFGQKTKKTNATRPADSRLRLVRDRSSMRRPAHANVASEKALQVSRSIRLATRLVIGRRGHLHFLGGQSRHSQVKRDNLITFYYLNFKREL